MKKVGIMLALLSASVVFSQGYVESLTRSRIVFKSPSVTGLETVWGSEGLARSFKVASGDFVPGTYYFLTHDELLIRYELTETTATRVETTSTAELDRAVILSFLASTVAGQVVFDEDENAVIESTLESGQVKTMLEAVEFNVGDLSIPNLRIHTRDSHNLYYMVRPTAVNFLRATTTNSTNVPEYQRPSTPRNGCISTSSSRGSRLTCYQGGRVTYRSRCTVSSNYEITCRSESTY